MSTLIVDAIKGTESSNNDIEINANGEVEFKSPVAFTNPATNINGDKNVLINGDMRIAQRGASAGVSGGYQTLDRWQTDFSGLGGFTMSRSTDVPDGQGFTRSLKMDCTSGDPSPASSDRLTVRQKIEGGNLQHFMKGTANAQKMTLSFWVKSNKTGTYVVKFKDANGRFISKTYTIDSSSTWEKKIITVEGDTGGSAISDNANEGLQVEWWLGAGSNYTLGLNGSWDVVTDDLSAGGQVNLADAISNEWYMTGTQLEVGPVATNFEFISYDRLFAKCQRYYLLPKNSSYGWQGRRGGGRFFRVNNRTQGSYDFPVPMRAPPSFTATRLYGDGTWASGTCYAGNGWANPTANNYVNFESNVNPESGSGNGGTFGFNVVISAELS
jgi:hypothetical protein